MLKTKKATLLSLLTLVIFLLIAFIFRNELKSKLRRVFGYPTGTGRCLGCAELFQDNIKTHELAYNKKDCISPQPDDRSLYNLFVSGALIKIASNNRYTVQSMDYSSPYISKRAGVFIEELFDRYYLKCLSDSLTYVPFVISSLTRSKQSVKNLLSRNPNAIENSAHLKGKTFDINYLAFDDNKLQTKAFISSLKQLRAEGKCYVKFEKNGCLHITVI